MAVPEPPSNLYGAHPRLVAQLGHSAGISAVAFSPDSRLAATGGVQDRSVVLWEVETGLELRRFPADAAEPPSGYIGCVTFSPQGDVILAGTTHGTLMAWDVDGGDLLHQAKGCSGPQPHAAISPDGRHVLSGGDEGATVQSMGGGSPSVEFSGHSYAVRNAVFSPGGLRAATSDSRRTTIVWSTDDGAEIFRVEGDARVACFLPDGRLVTAGHGCGRVWSRGGEEQTRFEAPERSVEAVSVAPDGSVLTGGSEVISRWDAESGARLGQVTSHELFSAPQCFSPDGRYLLAGSIAEPLALLWDTREGTAVRSLEGRASWVTALALSADAKRLATGRYEDTRYPGGEARLWNLETGQEERRFDNGNVVALEFRKEGEVLLVSDTQFTHAVDSITGDEVGRYKGALAEASSRSGATRPIATRGFHDVLLWEDSGEAPFRTLAGGDREITRIGMSADGSTVAACAAGEILVWDTESGEGRLRIDRAADHQRDEESEESFPVAVSNHGAVVYGRHRLWSTESGALISRLEGPSDPLAVEFSPSDGELATGESDHTVRLWDLETAKRTATFRGHWADVTAVRFTPDGKSIVSASVDGTTRLWNRATGREVVKMISFHDGSWAVVDDEGRYDASNGGDVEGLHWVVAGETVGLSQLKERYYDPGLLAKRMGAAAEPVREVSGFNEIGLSFYPKVVILDSPTPESPALRFRLENCGGGIGRVAILVNGKEALADARPENVATSPYTHETIEITVDLATSPLMIPGEDNRIEVVAYNAEGHLASRGSKAIGRNAAAPAPEPPRLWALVAGISNYSGSKLDLSFAAKDARDFAGALRLAATTLFDEDRVRVTLLTDQAVTRSGWEGALYPMTAAKASDILVVYFAGHGLTWGGADGDYYYLLSEATSFDLADPAVRERVALSADQVTESIKRIPALKQVLILDTCSAGQLIADIGAGRSVSSSQARSLERLKDRTGMFVLAGSAADAVSYETTRFGQGLLTYSLLLGMKGAALRDDEFVDVATWFGHAVERVPALARGVGGVQQPRVAVPRGGESFDVGSLPGSTRNAIPLAAEKPVVVRASFQHETVLDDPLDLSGVVTDALRTAALEARAPFVFVDARRFPDSFRLFGRYGESADELHLSARLTHDGRGEPIELDLSGSKSNLTALAGNLVERLEKAVAA